MMFTKFKVKFKKVFSSSSNITLLSLSSTLYFACNSESTNQRKIPQIPQVQNETQAESKHSDSSDAVHQASNETKKTKNAEKMVEATPEMEGIPAPSDDTTPAPTKPAEPPAKFGFRNFESAHSTMAALTGIAKNNPRVVAAFSANKVSLLTDPMAKSITSSSVVGLYKLATTYCDEFMKDTTLRTSFFGTFDFAGLPQTVLADAGKKQIAEALVTKFWGKDLARLPPHDVNVSMVMEVLNELLTMNPTNTAQTTLRVISGSCASALMSSQAMLY